MLQIPNLNVVTNKNTVFKQSYAGREQLKILMISDKQAEASNADQTLQSTIISKYD